MKAAETKNKKTANVVEKKTSTKVSKTWLAMMTLKGGKILDMRVVMK
jgi:hypothetical protein